MNFRGYSVSNDNEQFITSPEELWKQLAPFMTTEPIGFNALVKKCKMGKSRTMVALRYAKTHGIVHEGVSKTKVNITGISVYSLVPPPEQINKKK